MIIPRPNSGSSITSSRSTSSNVISLTPWELILGICSLSCVPRVLELGFVGINNGDICGSVIKVYTTTCSLFDTFVTTTITWFPSSFSFSFFSFSFSSSTYFSSNFSLAFNSISFTPPWMLSMILKVGSMCMVRKSKNILSIVALATTNSGVAKSWIHTWCFLEGIDVTTKLGQSSIFISTGSP